MKAKIITYYVAHKKAHLRSKLNRELNGYTDVSHGGRYKYRRLGLLDSVIHKKLAKNTIVATEEPAKLIIDLLKEYDAKINTISIRVNLKELQK
jgi:hypothetical protein